MKYLTEWRKYIETFLRSQIQYYKQNNKIENVLEIGVGTSTNIVRQYFTKFTIIDSWIHPTWKDVRKVDLCKDVPNDMKEFFDLIFCIEVLEHTKQPWIAANSLSLMLKPNGILLVSVPSLFEHHPGAPNTFGDYWRFLPGHISLLFPTLTLKKEGRAVFQNNLTGMTYTLIKNNL